MAPSLSTRTRDYSSHGPSGSFTRPVLRNASKLPLDGAALLLRIEILHHHIYIYNIYIICMYCTTRSLTCFVYEVMSYEVYIRSCRISTVNSFDILKGGGFQGD